MTTSDDIEADKRSDQPSLFGLVLFFVMQGVAVILVGFAALFISFEPVWSAPQPAQFIKTGDARSGSLLLKTDEGYNDAARLGIDVDLTVSGPTGRARGTQIIRNPTQKFLAIHDGELPGFPAMNGPTRAIRSIAIRDSIAAPSSPETGRRPNMFKTSRTLGKEIKG